MSALNKVCFNWEGIILFLKLLECEVEVLLERSKLELGGTCLLQKNKKTQIICHKALFQSFSSQLT